MFKISPIKSLKTVVKVAIPQDFGKTTPADFQVEFKKLPVSEVKTVLKNIESGETEDLTVMQENIINIEGLKDEGGQDIEYGESVLENIMEMEYVRKPLVKSFMEVQIGQEAARRKN